MDAWLNQLLSEPDMLQMGHGQDAATQSLGLGWIYYGLARALRPRTVVVIGSWRGFVPLIFGKALRDNGDGGRVVFIDPSYVDDFWTGPARVTAHFARFGIDNIDHHCMTTEAFTQSTAFATLKDVGVLFVDVMHTASAARFDYETFRPRLSDDGITLFHDSIWVRTTRIYGADKAYEHRVKDYIDDLRRDSSLDVLDIALAGGLTLVRERRS